MSYIRYYNIGNQPNEYALPFEVNYNFGKVIAHWEELASRDDHGKAQEAKELLAKLDKHPELKSSFKDLEVIERNQDLVQSILSPIFPELTTLNEIKAASMPFTSVFFNTSQRLKNILDAAGDDNAVKMRHFDDKFLYVNACVFILNFYYGAGINNQRTFYFDIPNVNTGITRHYRIFINADFSSIRPSKDFKELTKEEIKELKDNFDNVALWKEKIPPKSFIYEGFAILNMFDVTEELAISGLKDDLLKKDALQSAESVNRIRQNLSSVTGVKDLKLGFAAYDAENGFLKSLGYGFWDSITLDNGGKKYSASAFCEFSHKHLFEQKKIFTISTVPKMSMPDNPMGKKLVKNKLRGYVAVPLIYAEEIIGVLELGTEKPGQLNAVVTNRLESVVPLFTTALKRSLNELENELEAIVQEKYTAIHPTVSWKFMEVAENILRHQRNGNTTEVEDIAFQEVHPLYGQSDIKGSSTARNQAIQEDMIEQLKLAKKVLELAMESAPLPIYQELKFRIGKYGRKLKKGLGAGDEISILEFLKSDIYPVFSYLKSFNEETKKAVETYKSALDPQLGVIYKKRKDYEDTVKLINDKMADFIDAKQLEAQHMFPHYFEKYKTDGVEHNLYIGKSLVNHLEFNPVHLQNLRLWQLMVTCEIENMMHQFRPHQPIPLEIASLILVHHNPISIKFRMEEKRFDVEGAYNIRYEIIKKRIDKALIKGTTDRLTQPGKIAIVYSQEKEAREYANYLEYLQSIDYIGPNIEWVELNDLQGVTGLKAIRVDINFDQTKRLKKKEVRKILESEKAFLPAGE